METAGENASVSLVYLGSLIICLTCILDADTAGVPVVYVMAEDGFKPTGWLALLMGKALYVNGRSIEEMRGNMGELVRRVSGKQVTSLPPGSGGDVKAAAPTSFSPSPATSEVSLALKAMMEKMEMMAEEIKQTRADIAQLRSEIRASRQ